MIPRTARHNAVLAAIRKLTIGGVTPSLAELAAELGYAHKAAVHDVLTAMRDRGLITWTPRQARSIQIVEYAGRPVDQFDQLTNAALRNLILRARWILANRNL